jgi:iron complex outermembrane receptor protein
MLHGLSLYVQGQNLTDERSATVDPRIPNLGFMKYQTYGRRFVAGFTYKFGAAAPTPPPPPPPPPPAPATQTCPDGSVIDATAACPAPPPPPPPPPPPVERGERGR